MQTRDYELDTEKLERLLASKGWTSGELVKRGLFCRRRVDQIMRGRQRVYRRNVKELADLFGVRPEDLIKCGQYGDEPDKSKVATSDVILATIPVDF